MCYAGIVNLLDQYFNVMYKLKVSYDLQYFLLPSGVTQKQTENRTSDKRAAYHCINHVELRTLIAIRSPILITLIVK